MKTDLPRRRDSADGQNTDRRRSVETGVQTFLPYEDFAESAKCLDTKRLGKQRVEALQILNALLKPDAKGWKNHPAVKMWRGNERTLIQYGLAICDEWRSRGHRDTVREKLLAWSDAARGGSAPQWLSDGRLHASHRASLLRKDPSHYSAFGWEDDPTLPYFWPIG